MMQLLFHVSFFLLCCLLLLSPVLSLQCGEEQYAWPFENSKKCCAKCAPGTFMTQDPDYSCHNECEDCNGGRYMETYNVKTHCDVCDTCSNPNMELKKNCSVTENTVCGCEAGYRCKDQPCTVCVKIPSSTPPPSTTAFSSESEPIGGGQGNILQQWFPNRGTCTPRCTGAHCRGHGLVPGDTCDAMWRNYCVCRNQNKALSALDKRQSWHFSC
ncbi:CD27 antigen isoform X2 [Gouania willdenowi]|uniref:CD27 antigen isoform X2 n=1 Tax=Gouania willdenowi TaxID=441366 RepID=UPI001056744B|nr:CD27 antigen isoform X2 [Gouania willdenowi]